MKSISRSILISALMLATLGTYKVAADTTIEINSSTGDNSQTIISATENVKPMTKTNVQQLVKPHLNQRSTSGWCELYAENVFGTSEINPSATDGKNYAKSHQDYYSLNLDKLGRGDAQTLPKGVAVPIYITLDWEPAGHVVIWNGKGGVYTSGMAAGLPTTYYSLATFAKILKQQMKVPGSWRYFSENSKQHQNPSVQLGWSTHIGRLQVAKMSAQFKKGSQVQLRPGAFSSADHFHFIDQTDQALGEVISIQKSTNRIQSMCTK